MRLSRLSAAALLAAISATASAMPSAAGQAAAAPGPVVADMRIQVAADGSVLEVVPDASVPAELHALLRDRVSGWQFSVPTWQGRAVSLWIEYTLWLQPVPTTAGGFALRVVPPGVRDMRDDDPRKAPVYPESLMRRGIGGAFVYQLQIAADGTLGELRRRQPEGDLSRDLRRLDRSAQEAIAGSEWPPVVVDGGPIACSRLYSMVFTPSGSGSEHPNVDALKATIADLCPQSHLETPVLGTLL